jgi:hypothetical protein
MTKDYPANCRPSSRPAKRSCTTRSPLSLASKARAGPATGYRNHPTTWRRAHADGRPS